MPRSIRATGADISMKGIQNKSVNIATVHTVSRDARNRIKPLKLMQ